MKLTKHTLLACLLCAAAPMTSTSAAFWDKGSVATPGEYQEKNYSHLLGMEGFSDNALQSHFKLYAGYVKNTNLLLEKLGEMARAGTNQGPEWAEMRRRLGWEFDGMRLHELYFENMGSTEPLKRDAALFSRIERDFGGYNAWQRDFVATGKMRGIGWVVLYEDTVTGRLINCWINEHDLGHLSGAKPILVMDVFEHAYMIDYGLDRGSYIDAFMKNINWEVANRRLG